MFVGLVILNLFIALMSSLY